MTDPMKSGAGDDPFADDGNSNASDSDPGRELVSETDHEASTETEVEIPWVFRRNRVSDGRPQATQFELREDTYQDLQNGVNSAVNRLARKVGLDVDDSQFYVTDAREAILLAGMQNLDDAADQLNDWGYDRVESDE